MNTKFRKEAKTDFEKDFFKLMNNAVFGKTMENVRKHRDIKLVTTNKRRNYLVSEPKYHTTKWFSENLMYDFCMIILNQSIKIMQNYVTWIQTALLFILKVKMFQKILQMMLKKDLIHQIMKLNAIPLIGHSL